MLISVAMFTINSSQSLVMNYYFFLGLHTALHVKVDLLDMLYQKSLRLGVDVRNARGVGTVVNLQSNDASKVWMMPVHIHTLWNSPFQVCLSAAVIALTLPFGLLLLPLASITHVHALKLSLSGMTQLFWLTLLPGTCLHTLFATTICLL